MKARLIARFRFLIALDQAHNVTIHNKERSLRAGSQHEFTCEALGSRPAAIITWWFDEEKIQPEVDNVQIVSIQFDPIIMYLLVFPIAKLESKHSLPKKILPKGS